ncbi:MAG: hypothetical protein RBT36_03605 [Desulfobulbus sp.]|jgi:hypothetical protein|nr:hypothetical protein [Desulfobulbus sp.]
MTRICCRCTRVEQGDQWLTSYRAPVVREPMTHAYCPDCYEAMLFEIETQCRDRRTGARIDRLQPVASEVCSTCA